MFDLDDHISTKMYVSSISIEKKETFIAYKNMDLDELFVLNLKKWRKKMGFSQKTLAERCNAAHSYIRQIESGRGHPSFAFIGKLANALNIEPYELFYETTVAQPGKSIQSEHMESIKGEFIEKMTHEFDMVIEKMKS